MPVTVKDCLLIILMTTPKSQSDADGLMVKGLSLDLEDVSCDSSTDMLDTIVYLDSGAVLHAALLRDVSQ
jgi:hypothetical protein